MTLASFSPAADSTLRHSLETLEGSERTSNDSNQVTSYFKI